MIVRVKMSEATREAIAVHQAAGGRFSAGGVGSFVREQGQGGAVVCVHGVPTSSFLYRKLVPGLAGQGLRAIAFDLPGLGLADRPRDFDYSWSGLSRWTGEAIDALEIDRCHLVVHDIGGPIALEWAIRNPDRVLSVTVLNTMLEVAGFRRPWMMAPFARRGIGEAWLAVLQPGPGSELFYRVGIANRSATPRHEVQAHIHLLKHRDRGRAFLRIMRGFELTDDKQRFLWEGLADRPWPARVIWGEQDSALGLDQLEVAARVLDTDDVTLLPAKHFLQEDQSPAIANAVGDLAAPLG
jgi:pimeloyl-ACP methyl ester carboxylesterase